MTYFSCNILLKVLGFFLHRGQLLFDVADQKRDESQMFVWYRYFCIGLQCNRIQCFGFLYDYC